MNRSFLVLLPSLEDCTNHAKVFSKVLRKDSVCPGCFSLCAYCIPILFSFPFVCSVLPLLSMHSVQCTLLQLLLCVHATEQRKHTSIVTASPCLQGENTNIYSFNGCRRISLHARTVLTASQATLRTNSCDRTVPGCSTTAIFRMQQILPLSSPFN